MLANAHGDRLDQAPIAIVTDGSSPAAIITNGVSCIRCHGAGLNPRSYDAQQKRYRTRVENQVLTHVENNPKVFATDLAQILKLYKGEKELEAQMEQDIARFTGAFGSVAPKSNTSMNWSYSEHLGPSFRSELGLTRAAAELGITSGALQKNLRTSPQIARRLGILVAGEQVEEPSANSPVLRGGTVKRQVFDEAFPEMVRAWGYAGYPPTAVTPSYEVVNPSPSTSTFRPSSTWGWGAVLLGVALGGLGLLAFLVGVSVGRAR